MPGQAEYNALVNAAATVTPNLPSGTNAEQVALRDAIGNVMVASANLFGVVAANPNDFPEGDEPYMRVDQVHRNIQTVFADADRLEQGQMPPNDRVITEGPANVFSQNVQNFVGTLQAAWFS